MYPFLKKTSGNHFTKIWQDKGSGANDNVIIWRPKPPSGYTNIGDYATQGSYSGTPSQYTPVTYIKNTSPFVKNVADYQRIWKDSGSGADWDGSIWRPISNDGNYVALGYAGARDHDKKPHGALKLVNKNYLSRLGAGIEKTIWNDRGSGADKDVILCKAKDLHTFFSNDSHSCGKGFNGDKQYRIFPDSTKLNCCMGRENNGFNKSTCGNYWGPSGDCDLYMTDYCKEHPKEKICSCFNAKDKTGRAIPQPQCFYADCIQTGYQTRNMKTGPGCATWCQQVFDIGGSENVAVDSSQLKQYCGSKPKNGDKGNSEPPISDEPQKINNTAIVITVLVVVVLLLAIIATLFLL